ncbi:MAG: hypothetical protein DI570_20730 [Phenylobacterium zucineum]|nr:MAG: hypothetical protein DI570_20730 [Phenylobacterium zucineum]
MRALCLLTCSLIVTPAVALAQTPVTAPNVLDVAAHASAPPAPVLAPLPTVEPTAPAPAPVVAKPAPAPVTDASAPVATSAPTTIAPDIVEKPDKDGLGDKLGTVVGGVAGGAAGAAVAGPVGKFAGGFLGRKLVQGVFGGKKDDVPQVTAVARAPSADSAAQPAVAAPATAPPLKQARNEEADAL